MITDKIKKYKRMASSYFKLKLLKRKYLKTIKQEQCEFEKLPAYQNRKIVTDVKDNNVCFTCRICLRNDGNIPIYGKHSNNISDSVSFFGGVNICENDELPKHLCASCYGLLHGAILFRSLARESNLKLQQHLELNNEDVPSSDTEEKPVTNENIIRSYTCTSCNMPLSDWDKLIQHRKQHRNVRVQCSICNKVITSKFYKKHLERHQRGTHGICEVCGKVYRKDNLTRHLQLHTLELPFQCQLCPYKGRYADSLKLHMRSHTGDKPYSCEDCQLRFLTKSNLNRHLLTHKKEKPHKCIECGRGFHSKRDLDIHFKSDHGGVQDYGCRLCGNKYGSRKALMRHELRVHKRDKMAKGRMPLYLRPEYKTNQF